MRYIKTFIVVSALAITSLTLGAADQGSIAYWSADDLKSGHAANMPFMTATHAFNVLRLRAADARKAESHEGTTDILFVVSGTGRVTAGGRIEGSAPLPGMPGELRGASITGGQSYRLTPNAVINIPPSTPYLVQADGGDLTIVRLKVNAGMHPWSIVSTQQTTLGADRDPSGSRRADQRTARGCRVLVGREFSQSALVAVRCGRCRQTVQRSARLCRASRNPDARL